MRIMNKLIIGILTMFLTLGCTDLSEKVYSEIEMDDFFKNEKELISYAGRAYTRLQNYNSEQSLWTLVIQVTDECGVPLSASGSWSNVRYIELQQHTYNDANGLVAKGWNFCFNGLTSCNEIIHEIESASVEFEGKAKILSEIKILRAFFYFMATDGWGNIPFTVDYTETGYPKQVDRKFMFEWLETEIKANISLLEETPSSDNYGRVTKGMAYTLLAKLYLMAQEWIGVAKWAEAEEYCSKVIDSGKYIIEDKYSDNFKPNNQTSKENIFSIVYSTIYTSTWDEGFGIQMLGLGEASMATFNLSKAPWDGFVCQPDFFDTYDVKDTRRSDSYLYGQQYTYTGEEIEGFIIDPEIDPAKYTTGRGINEGARICKWRYQTDGRLVNSNSSLDNDFALFRYADVVLMHAEALIRQSRGAEIISDPAFVKIRTRAGLDAYTAGELTLEELFQERGRELAWEGWRRQDLIRFGKYNDAWWAKPASKPSAKLYPIPLKVLAANPNLTQNN